jgi:hypothetical protein
VEISGIRGKSLVPWFLGGSKIRVHLCLSVVSTVGCIFYHGWGQGKSGRRESGNGGGVFRELRELSRIKPELRAVFNSWKLAEFAEKVRANGKAEGGKAGKRKQNED